MNKCFLILLATLSLYAQNAFSGLYTAENNLFDSFPDYFKKNGNELTLSFTNKKSKTFVSKPNSGDATVEYALESYNDEDNTVVLRTDMYESVEYTLVHLTDGAELKLIGAPIWNDEFNKFVTLNYDQAKYQETGGSQYQLGFCKNNVCTLGKKEKGNYTQASWAGNDQLVFTKVTNVKCKIKDKKLNCK